MNDAKAYLQTLPFWNELTPTQQEMLEEAVFFRGKKISPRQNRIREADQELDNYL